MFNNTIDLLKKFLKHSDKISKPDQILSEIIKLTEFKAQYQWTQDLVLEIHKQKGVIHLIPRIKK